MKIKSKLSSIAISAKLRAGVNFDVANANERQRVLTGAKFLGLKVSTRQKENGTFTVFHV